MATSTGNKMIYVSKGSHVWWERAEKLAASRDLPLSKFIAQLLRREVLNASLVKDEPTVEELLDQIEDLQGQLRMKVTQEIEVSS